MRRIETSTLSNQSLATALLCHTYTADADRLIFVRVFGDQLAGNGDYVAYLTVQRLGAGSAYRVVPITTAAVASGVTAAMLTTIGVPVKSTDVVKVYLTGLAGDTTTPDVITEIWEDELHITVGAAGAGLTAAAGLAAADITTLLSRLSAARAGYLDNLSAGAVALASALATAQADLTTLLSRVTGAVALATSTTAAAIRAALGMAAADLDDQLDALPTAAEINAALTTAHGSGSWTTGSALVGSGAVAYLPEAIVDENADPVDGAAVWVTLTSDPQGTVVAGTVFTQANGLLADSFQLDPGDYYLQISLSRYQHKTVAFEVEAS